MLYDLHIHSCLSPCASSDMTPATIAGFAKLAGADIIAVCDHNSAENLPAVHAACKEYELMLLPGIEVNTAEEIHILCYFKTVAAAEQMSRAIYDTLPDFEFDREIWGSQLVMDENDEILREIPKLLTSACGLDLYECVKLCKSLGGIAVPAHAEKDSYSLLSVLGFAPEDMEFPVIELKSPEKYAALSEKGFLPTGSEILTSSDAHSPEQICVNMHEISQSCFLLKSLVY